MAVSGSIDAAYTGSDIVTYARSLLGIQAAEETLQAHELTEGLFWLTVMLKAWEADGVMAWVLTEGSFALVQSDADYVFGSGGTDIPGHYVRVPGISAETDPGVALAMACRAVSR